LTQRDKLLWEVRRLQETIRLNEEEVRHLRYDSAERAEVNAHISQCLGELAERIAELAKLKTPKWPH